MPKHPRSVIVDHRGNPFPIKASSGAYDAASTSRRAFSWYPTVSHPNALQGDIELVRRRGRDAVRRNPWGASAENGFVSNLIGTGIRPIVRVDDEDLRLEVTEAWEDFVEECHTEGTTHFYGIQEITGREVFQAGEGLVRSRARRPQDGLGVPLQLQPLEAEHLDSHKDQELSGGRYIRAGIEFDALGRRVAYWLFRDHPHEGRSRTTSNISVRVPAAQVYHVYPVMRAGQCRGVPLIGPSLTLLKELIETRDAYALRVKLQNLITSWEETPAESIYDEEAGVEDDPEEDEDGTPVATAEPGEHRVLPPGHKVNFNTPQADASNYEAFFRDGIRAVAAPAFALYEQVSGDLRGVTFSSVRAGLIELRREIEQLQKKTIIFQLCRPVWRDFIVAGGLAGRFRLPTDPAEMRSLLRPFWQPQGWEYVQPKDDADTAIALIEAGLSSRTREITKRGDSPQEIDRERAKDAEREKDLGIERAPTAKPGGGPADESATDGETGEAKDAPEDGEERDAADAA